MINANPFMKSIDSTYLYPYFKFSHHQIHKLILIYQSITKTKPVKQNKIYMSDRSTIETLYKRKADKAG